MLSGVLPGMLYMSKCHLVNTAVPDPHLEFENVKARYSS